MKIIGVNFSRARSRRQSGKNEQLIVVRIKKKHSITRMRCGKFRKLPSIRVNLSASPYKPANYKLRVRFETIMA